ncbi:DUF4184 family protein [Streptosporangiaceae bacterium NEAU-GS5]|nr:DUF4184 family protein [Streptosporangiaceae bacterium NEAU-GS5]
MPFTASHIAAVVPLMSSTPRRYLDPWALAFGSMAPDLPLFLPGGVADYHTWHSPLGIACYTAPAAVAMLALFQVFFRDPLTALLPPRLGGKVGALPAPRWRRLPAIAAGALVGGATHVFWDSFTHSWGARFWDSDLLGAQLVGRLTVYRLLQYGSTAAGLAVLIWMVLPGRTWMAPRVTATVTATATDERPALPSWVRHGMWALTVAAGLLTGVIRQHVILGPYPPGWPEVLAEIGKGGVVGCFVALTAYAAVWHGGRMVTAAKW